MTNEQPKYNEDFPQSQEVDTKEVGEDEYEKMFKPYCINFLEKSDEETRKERWQFALDKKDEAFELFKEAYDTSYGSIHVDGNLVSIHSGGWSENEAIIYEFKKTEWWKQNLVLSIVGGHYYFDTTKYKGEKEWDVIKKPNNPSPLSQLKEGVNWEEEKTHLENVINGFLGGFRQSDMTAKEAAKRMMDFIIEPYARHLSPSTERGFTESELSDLKKVRNYFGEHSKTQFEHWAYSFLDNFLTSIK